MILFLSCRPKLFVSGECYRLQCPVFFVVGSMEEKWYLQIMDKGSVSCPTCQAVGRKTIEDLKKHMGNCKQVSYFVAFCDCWDFLKLNCRLLILCAVFYS